MISGVGVPIGIVRIDYKYCKRVLIRMLSDAFKVDLKVLFGVERIFADLKFLVDGSSYFPWPARARNQDVGFWFSQEVNRKLDGLFAPNGHKHIFWCQFLWKITV